MINIADMKATNQELLMSYVGATARHDLNKWEQRVLLVIINTLQAKLEGQKINASFQKAIEGTTTITMATQDFLPKEGDNNHSKIKKALKSLNDRRIEYDNGEIWKIIRLIELPRLETKGLVSFTIHEELENALLDFKKGHRKFEHDIAYELSSSVASRFYIMFSKQKRPQTFTIDQLRQMFRLEDKYPDTSNFIRRVIKPAQKKLDEKAPYSFTFTRIKKGKKVSALLFTPIYIAKNQNTEVAKTTAITSKSNSDFIASEIITCLKNDFSFTEKGIRNNRGLISEARLRFKSTNEFYMFLQVKKGVVDEIQMENPQGYVINSLKGKLDDPVVTQLDDIESNNKPLSYLDKITEESKRISQELAKKHDEQRKKEQS